MLLKNLIYMKCQSTDQYEFNCLLSKRKLYAIQSITIVYNSAVINTPQNERDMRTKDIKTLSPTIK